MSLVSRIHVEPTNICTLKCPGCARTQFINRWPQHWKNYSIDVADLVRFIDIKPAEILFCGNDGDPIYHKDFHNLINQVKAKDIAVTIVTNGSYRTADWWHQLVGMLDHKDSIVFSIDGTPENFTQYRINGDWDSIKIGIDAAANSRCKTTWKFIPFSYNQDCINSAEQLSKELGIDHFYVDNSDRFDEHTNLLKPVDLYLGPRFQHQESWKSGNPNEVDPKCASGQEHYISASGMYSACCYLADFRFYYKTVFGKNKKQFEIKNTTLSKILQTKEVINFSTNLKDNPVCQFNCPKKTLY